MSLLQLLLADISSESRPRVLPVNGTDPVIDARDNIIYLCSSRQLSSLTISSLPESGMFELIFRTGDELPTVRFPDSVQLTEDLELEANTIYELSVMNCLVGGSPCSLAAVQSWPDPASA